MSVNQGIPAGYKQTEVGVIPAEWHVARLRELAPIATGTTPPTSDPRNYGHEFLFASPADIGASKYVLCTQTHLSKRGFELSRQLPKNSVLFVCIGSTIGKCGVAGTDLATNQQINAILPVRHLSSDYLYYALTAAAPRVRVLAGEQAVPLINKTQFSDTYLQLPPLDEQRAIADALGDVDALLDTLDRLIAKKRDLKQAAMQQLLTARTRLPGFTGKWQEVEAGSLGRFVGGSGFPQQFQGKRRGCYPYFKVSDMNMPGNEVFMSRANNYVSDATRRRLGALVIPRNAIVFAKVGAAVYLERKKITAQSSCIDNNMAAFVIESDAADVRFVHFQLLGIRLALLANTTALPAINGRSFATLRFNLPPIDEQTAIATILSDMEAEIATLETRRTKTRNIKQAMMQELLTGRTRLIDVPTH